MRTAMIGPSAPAAGVDGRPNREGPGIDARYSYRLGVHELTLIRRGIVPDGVTAVARGEAEFALLVDDPLVWLCYRFGAEIPWGAALYEGGAVARGRHELPPEGGPAEGRALLHVRLVVTDDGVPCATRNVDLRLDFTRALHAAIREQARCPIDPHERKRALHHFHQRFPSVEAMVARARVRSPASP